MLSFVRKHADSWMIKAILWLVVFAFIATIFYSWGMGGTSSSKGGVIATINGTKIRFGEYEQSFNNLVQLYRNQLGSRFSSEIIEKLDLKTASLDGLIQKKLLLQEAEKYKIGVSDQELVDHIKSFPAFQRNNQFDRNLYTNFLKFQRITPKEFETNQKENLLLSKMENLIKSQTKITEKEILEAFEQEEKKIKFNYISFTEDYFKSSEPATEEEKKQYYEKNRSHFQVPEQIRVQYVKIATQKLQGKIIPRKSDIEDYYNSQIGKFYVEDRFKASHILFQINTEGFDSISNDKERKKRQKEAEIKTLERAHKILKRIQAGADFVEMAKKYSDDKTSGSNGGDLGQFPRGTMVSEFEKTLLKLKVGGISKPVKTPFGYHLIRLNERENAHTLPLREVKNQIIQSVKEIKARQRARRIAKHIFKSSQVNNDLVHASETQSIKTKTTDFISRKNHNVVSIGVVPEFFNAAFQLKDQEISEPIHTTEASYVLKLMQRKAPYIPEIDQVESKMEGAIRKQKNKKLTEENIKIMAKQISQNQSLDQIANSLKIKIQSTPFFSENNSIPGIGNIQVIKDVAFSLKKGQTTWVKAPNRFLLIQLMKIQPARNLEADDSKGFYIRLKEEKGNMAFNNWLKNLQNNAEILIDRTLL